MNYLFPISKKYPQTAEKMFHEYLIVYVNGNGRECSAGFTSDREAAAKLAVLHKLKLKVVKTETRFYDGFISV